MKRTGKKTRDRVLAEAGRAAKLARLADALARTEKKQEQEKQEGSS